MSCSSDSAVTDLPEPDSPTSARVSPRSSVKDAPRTTHLAPKLTDRSWTSTRLIGLQPARDMFRRERLPPPSRHGSDLPATSMHAWKEAGVGGKPYGCE